MASRVRSASSLGLGNLASTVFGLIWYGCSRRWTTLSMNVWTVWTTMDMHTSRSWTSTMSHGV